MISKINNLAWKSISWLERMRVRLRRRRRGLNIVVQPAERSGRNKTDSVWRSSFIPARGGPTSGYNHHSSLSGAEDKSFFGKSI